MGKKRLRKRSSRRHDDKCSTSVTVGETDIKMLAWLDYTLSRLGTRGLFCDTIERYLGEDYGVLMTLEQVKQRLECLSKRFSTGWHDVYRQGSTCLFSIDEQARAEIADRVVCLQIRTPHPAIHGDGRRILRSGSQASDSLVAQHINLGTEASKTSPPSFHKRCQNRKEGCISRTNDTSFSWEVQVGDSLHLAAVPKINLKRQDLPLDPTDPQASR
jgi:hypothetical protein